MSLPKRHYNYRLTAPWDATHDYNAISVGNSRILPPVPSRNDVIQREAIQELVPVVNSNIPHRIDSIEERLQVQERTTQGLIDRAYKIKEDVIDSLNFTHGSWTEEKNARVVLQEHIRTITAVVNRLNADIAAIEESIRSRDNAHVGTNNAVKSLEVHHVASLTDLKGRVVRCDSTISKLSQDMHSCFDSVRHLNSQQQEVTNRITERMSAVDQQLLAVNNSLERNYAESRMKLSHLEGDTSTQMSMMDGKARQLVEDLKAATTTAHGSLHAERERLEQRLLNMIDKNMASTDVQMDKLGKKMEDIHYGLESRMMRLEEQMSEVRQCVDGIRPDVESRVLSRMDGYTRQCANDLVKLKQECREGFATVHENIGNVKTVMDGKRKLLEDQLRKEIGQIRQMIVLV